MSLAKMDVFCCECVNLDLLGREKIALTRLEMREGGVREGVEVGVKVKEKEVVVVVKKKGRGKNQNQEASPDTTTPASAVPNKSKLPALGIAVLCGMCNVGKMNPIQFLVG